MNPIWSIYVLLLVQWSWAQNSDEGVQISGTNDKCGEFCSKKFRNQDAPMKSCQQGCRLYSVLQFVVNPKDGLLPGPNSTAISISCQKECNDAYKDSGLKGACIEGCQHQTPFTTGHLKIVMDDSMPMFSFANKMMSDAFGKLDDLHNGMMEKFGTMRDWFKNDPLAKIENDLQDNNVMNFFNRIDAQFRNMFNSIPDVPGIPGRQPSLQQAPKSKNGGSTVNPLFAYAKNIAQNRGRDAFANGQVKSKQPASPLSNADDSSEPILVIKIVNSNGLFDGDDRRMMGPMMENKIWSTFTQESLNEKPHDPAPPVFGGEKTYFGPAGTNVESDDTWLACFARQTQSLPMLTRWLLCVALMLSILCMIYLCLTVMRASQQRRRRLYLQRKMDKTDAAYLMPPPNYEKVTPSPGIPFQESEKQRESPPPAYEIAVGPFPIQVNQNDSQVKQM